MALWISTGLTQAFVASEIPAYVFNCCCLVSYRNRNLKIRFLKRYLKAKRTRALAYSRALTVCVQIPVF